MSRVHSFIYMQNYNSLPILIKVNLAIAKHMILRLVKIDLIHFFNVNLLDILVCSTEVKTEKKMM